MKPLKFDNEAEEMFYDFLNNFELTSMIKKIESQVNIKFGNGFRRVDFVLTLFNGERIYLEVDGSTHNSNSIANKDYLKDEDAKYLGNHTIRVKFKDFFNDPQSVANTLWNRIELISYI